MKLNSYNFLLGLAFASSVAAPAAQAEIVIHG
ncbi:molecular chaperone, partial [Acinetobacter baumannii]